MDSYNDFYKAALTASDEGELIISIPDLDSSVQKNMYKDGTIVIRIYYHLIKPQGGVHFITPENMFTHNQICGARTWFPCVDNLLDRCTFEMEYTIDAAFVVVSTGELQRQVFNVDHSKKTFYYRVDIPTAAHCVAFSAAPYEAIAASELEDRKDKSKYGTLATYFCLPSRMKELAHTTAFLSQAFQFYEEYLGSPFPLKSFKLVFVEEAYSTISSSTSLAICSTHLLHDEGIIEQTYETRSLLGLTLAQQWFGNFIGVRLWQDTWLCYGLAGYLSDLFFRHMFGQNEYRYRMEEECNYVATHDLSHPLYYNSFSHPFDIMQSHVFRKKSALVMYIIERRVGADGFRKVLSNIVSPTMEGEQLDRNLTTKKFFKLIKKVTGHDLKSFADRWVFGKGCPNLTCSFFFNRKKNVVEFALKQNKSPLGSIPGSLMIRVHEFDGDSYDHAISFDDDLHSYELRCYSRVRKVRKKKRDETGAIVEEEEEPKKTEVPVLFVRVDPELDTIRYVALRQPEFMWLNQLSKDTDVIAQREAVAALQNFVQSFQVVDALNKILCDARCFYKIRMIAASAMSKSLNPGLDMLLKFYRTNYFDTEGFQLKPNDFSDFSSYFVQKATQEAISTVRNPDGYSSPELIEFVMDLLKNNDNTLNKHSDHLFVASLVRCVTNLEFPKRSDYLKIGKQLERFLSVEKILPSYHNSVTIACLESLCELQAANKLSLDLDKFREYTKYGHYEEVRLVAVRCLIKLGFFKNDVPLSLLNLVEQEKVPRVKAKIIEAMCVVPQHMDEQKYFMPLSNSFNPDNVELIRRIWIMLNSVDTAFDCRVRYHLRTLFQKIWGGGKVQLGNKSALNLGVLSSKQKVVQKRKVPEFAQIAKMPSEGKFKFIVKKPDTPKSVDFSPFTETSVEPKEQQLVTSPERHEPDVTPSFKRVKLLSDSHEDLRIQISLPLREKAKAAQPKQSQPLLLRIPKEKLQRTKPAGDSTPAPKSRLQFSKVRIRVFDGQNEATFFRDMNKT